MDFYWLCFCQRHPLICTGGGTSNKTEELDNIFIQTSFKNKTLSANPGRIS
jgi:hypothetical protein